MSVLTAKPLVFSAQHLALENNYNNVISKCNRENRLILLSSFDNVPEWHSSLVLCAHSVLYSECTLIEVIFFAEFHRNSYTVCSFLHISCHCHRSQLFCFAWRGMRRKRRRSTGENDVQVRPNLSINPASGFALFNPSPSNGFFATFAGNGGRGKNTPTPGISRVLEHIVTKFQRIPYVYGVKLSNGGTSDFVGRRCAPEIQDGSQITGSTTCWFYRYTCSSKNNTWVYDYVRNI